MKSLFRCLFFECDDDDDDESVIFFSLLPASKGKKKEPLQNDCNFYAWKIQYVQMVKIMEETDHL